MNSFDKSPEMAPSQLLPLTAEGHHLHFSAQKDDFKQPMEHIAKVTIDPRMLTKAGRNQ